MREEVRDIERLQHIIEATNVLVNYVEHHTLEQAQSDPVVYFGLVKHVEIIGEAVYKRHTNIEPAMTRLIGMT